MMLEVLQRLTKIETLLETQADLRARIEALEKFKWMFMGVAVAAGGLAGKLGSLIG
jgi:hypothetical protein